MFRLAHSGLLDPDVRGMEERMTCRSCSVLSMGNEGGVRNHSGDDAKSTQRHWKCQKPQKRVICQDMASIISAVDLKETFVRGAGVVSS